MRLSGLAWQRLDRKWQVVSTLRGLCLFWATEEDRLARKLASAGYHEWTRIHTNGREMKG